MTTYSTDVKILTWNIAFGGPSINAPKTWDKEQNLYRILDLIEEQRSDIIVLQEMPSTEFSYHLSNDYDYIDPVETHSGYTGIFVNRSIEIKGYVKEPPAVGVEITIENNDYRIFGCHLFPYKKNRKYRIAFLQQLINVYSTNEIPIIIAGDMNMRMDETSEVLEGTRIKDAYLESERHPDKRFTWDSTKNIFNKGPKFKCRFDRIFFSNLNLVKFELIGDKPLDSLYYLSDHFGIVAEFTLSNEIG